jgi:hypothetical protein
MVTEEYGCNYSDENISIENAAGIKSSYHIT